MVCHCHILNVFGELESIGVGNNLKFKEGANNFVCFCYSVLWVNLLQILY